MNVVLISPPSATPFAPPMATVALRSYLQSHGVSAVPIDANIDAIHHVAQPDRCRQLIEPILPGLTKGLPDSIQQALLPHRTMTEDGPLPPLSAERAAHVLDQLQRLWNPDGFALTQEGFTTELAVINDAMILASLRLFPTPLTVWGRAMGRASGPSAVQHPFLAYFRDELVPKVAALSPDVIGISIGHEEQLIYTILLIRDLRRAGLTVPIAMGGAYFTFLARRGDRDARSCCPLTDESGRPTSEAAVVGTLLEAFDSTTGKPSKTSDTLTVGVREEGEAALLQICQHLRGGQSILDVPNVIYADRERGEIVFNEIAPPLAATEFPVADLTGMGVGKKYLTPIPAAPLMSSRGCYWDQCTFCDHAHTLGPGYRQLPVDVVADSMASYRRDFGVEMVFFADESFSPAMVNGLTDALEQRDVFLHYGSMCRVEKAFIPLIEHAAKQGLKFMCMGWESACDRLVCRMNKGYTREDSETLIDECVRNGVKVLLFVMFGFPTETPAEADQTLAYLSENRDKILGINPMPWRLTMGSHVRAHPEEFGLAPAPGREISLDAGSFIHTEGMGRQEAHEYLDRLHTHPDLKHMFAAKGVEDFKILLSILEEPRAAKG